MDDKKERRISFGFIGSDFDPYEHNKPNIVGRLHLYEFQLIKTREYIDTAFEVKKQRNLLKIGVDINLRWHFQVASEALFKSAIVSLASLYNSGYEDNGKIAKNDKKFRSKYLEIFVQKALSDVDEYEKYLDIVGKVNYLRDKMIGHGDGDSRKLVQESIGQISMIDETELMEKIDFKFLGKAVVKIDMTINDYLLGKFKIENN